MALVESMRCGNDTVTVISQRTQVRGKVSKQSGHTSSPHFYLLVWNIKAAWYRYVIHNTILKSLCVYVQLLCLNILSKDINVMLNVNIYF